MRIYRRGDTWWVDFKRADGLRKRCSLGTGGRAEAERRAAGLIQKEQGGPGGPTVAVLLERWLSHKRTHTAKERSIEVYELWARRFTAEWGSIRADAFPAARIEEHKRSALESGFSAANINQGVGHFIAAMRWAQRLG